MMEVIEAEDLDCEYEAAESMPSEQEDETVDSLKGPHRVTKSGEPKLISFVQLNLMLCFNFANGVLLASYMLLVLPLESQRINYSSRSMVLGSLMCIAGVTQLINPLVGLLSDRCTSSWGRRRPFIVAGGLVGMMGIIAQDVASTNRSPVSYYIAYTTSMLALNTAYTAVVGIMPDLVPQEQTGTATGIAALHTVAGANVGFLVFYNVPGSHDAQLSGMYMTYVVITAICLIITVLTCDEVPLKKSAAACNQDREKQAGEGESWLFNNKRHMQVSSQGFLSTPLLWKDVLNAYYIDPRKHLDFTMVFCSRTLYYFGVSVQTFFKYYLKDVVGVEDAEAAIVKTAIIGQLCAAATAIPTGLLSDRIGRLRKPFIYGACAVLASGNVANLFVRSEADVLLSCGLCGAANGVYLAMDAALALDTLPSNEEAARFMGVWGIGCFLGGAVGPLLGGPILLLCGHNIENPNAYNYSGYAILLAMAAVCFLFSGVLLRRVGSQPASRERSLSFELGSQERSLSIELVTNTV